MNWNQSRINAVVETINLASKKSAVFSSAVAAARDFNQWNEVSNAGLRACQEASAYWASLAVEARCNLVNQP